MEENDKENVEIKEKKTRATGGKKKNTNDRLSNILQTIEVEEEKKPKKTKTATSKAKTKTTKKTTSKSKTTSKPKKEVSKVKVEKVEKKEKPIAKKEENKEKSKKQVEEEKTKKVAKKEIKEEEKEISTKNKPGKHLMTYEEKRQRELEEIGKEIKKQKEVPANVKNEINKRVFFDTLTAVGIMLCLILINIGYKFIYIDNFITSLRVLSIGFIAITIVIFEVAYKKESGRLTINGMEMMVLSIIVMLLPRLYYDVNDKFVISVELISMFFAIYYEIKALVDYIAIKKKVRKSDAKKIFVKK